MKEYSVWIIAMFADYAANIAIELVHNKCSVSALSNSGQLFLKEKNMSSTIIFFKVKSALTDCVSIRKIVSEACIKHKCKYYGIIVSEFTDCAWEGSNIIIPPDVGPVGPVE